MNTKRIIQVIIVVIGAILLCGGVGLLAFQLIPTGVNNPPVVKEPNWNSPQTRALTERACFDCHSNQTKWPWYAYVPPFSETIVHEVEEGRATLNFSEWHPEEVDEIVEVILEREMPPQKYLLLHPEARLTEAENKTLIAGLQATFGNNIGDVSERENGEKFEAEDEGRHEENEDGHEGEHEYEDDDGN